MSVFKLNRPGERRPRGASCTASGTARRLPTRRLNSRAIPFLACNLVVLGATSAWATNLRVVSYNVDDSDVGNNNNVADLTTVLQGIGNHHMNGNSQPFDVLGLEELLDTNNNNITSTTLSALVTSLNTAYGAGTYAFAATPDPTSGGTSTNGPSGLIYNTHTVQLIGTKVLGYSGTGAGSIPRAPMRYELQPVGYGSNSDFYMYVSHYKSASGSTSTRTAEATEIRADADALGANTHILYTGDHNLFLDSSEPAYQLLLAPGNGQAHDPGSPTQVWTADAAHVAIETESATNVEFRDDLQLTSTAIYNQAGVYAVPGLQLANGGVNSYIVFGNGSSPSVPSGGTAQPFHGSVNYAGNKTLNDLANSSTVLSALTTASDHLPVVADYTLVGINPLPAIWSGGIGNWSNVAQWTSGLVPNDPGVEVKIDNGNAISSLVTLDQNATIEDLTLSSGDTLSMTSGKTLTIDGPNATTLSGTVINSGSLAITGGAVTVAGGGVFVSTGSFSSVSNFSNAGTTSIGGTQVWSAGTTFTNSAGTASFVSDGGSASTSPLSVNVTGGTVSFASTQHLAALSIHTGATATVAAPSTHATRYVLVTGSLTFDGSSGAGWQGQLDLTGNDLVVKAGSLSDVASQLKAGFNAGSGYWNGSAGIVSTTAATDSTFLTTLGYRPGGISFDGVNNTSNDVLVKYTYFGDADLNGTVDGADYHQIDLGFAGNMTGWFNGDFNYVGIVDGADYALIDNTFNQIGISGAGPLAIVANPTALVGSDLATGVPEPTALALMTLTAAGTLARRRHCRK